MNLTDEEFEMHIKNCDNKFVNSKGLMKSVIAIIVGILGICIASTTWAITTSQRISVTETNTAYNTKDIGELRAERVAIMNKLDILIQQTKIR